MLISIIAAVFAIAVAALSAVLVLGTLPARNEVKGNEIITHYVLGNKTAIDISNAVFGEIPEEAKSHLIRVGGTSLGRFLLSFNICCSFSLSHFLYHFSIHISHFIGRHFCR